MQFFADPSFVIFIVFSPGFCRSHQAAGGYPGLTCPECATTRDARSGSKLAHVDETEAGLYCGQQIVDLLTPGSRGRTVKGHSSCVGLLARLVCLALPSRLVAQSTTGTIQGTITDAQKAVVPGATATMRNVATNAVRRAVSEKNGFYRLLTVPVGEYELTIERDGFSKYVRPGITVSLNQDAVVDVQLHPAGLTE